MMRVQLGEKNANYSPVGANDEEGWLAAEQLVGYVEVSR
jgi:hypothetical protein